MAYVALYRKYRSQSFGELMGQEHVTRTLQNAIRTGHIAHAYLFHGARGCGKTLTARLLARALNCVASDGPTPEPCGQCRLCLAIRDGNCLDVIEMDAASETGIDDVREKIIENVAYAPAEARFKVYIIDEAHDLSTKAFDALLKTLEEPPPHVVFVLATTEQHKVPITIRSRCQSHHFRRGTIQDLAAAVQRVIDAEGQTADPEAVQAIARAAEGSWRDSLSLLEQVLAFSEGRITADNVHQAIGTVGAETLARVTETILSGRWDAILGVAGELIESGKDVRQLLAALNGHLRDLMLICAGANEAADLELGPERRKTLEPIAAQLTPPRLLAMMQEVSKAERESRFTNQQRWLLESALLRMATYDAAPPVAHPSAQPAAAERKAAPARDHRPDVAASPAFIPKPAPKAAMEAAALSDELPPAAEAPTEDRFATAITYDVIRRAWPDILTRFRKKTPAGSKFLEDASVSALDGRMVVLTFSNAFSKERIHGKREFVERVIHEALKDDKLRIRCEVATEAASPTPDPVEPIAPLLDAPELPIAPQRIADFDIPVAATPLTAVVSNELSASGARTAETGAVNGPTPANGAASVDELAPADEPHAHVGSRPSPGSLSDRVGKGAGGLGDFLQAVLIEFPGSEIVPPKP